MQMFSFLFKPKKECFICYSTGKTKEDEFNEFIYNIKGMEYPLISMNDAYDCKCINNYAHNKCLLNINKCPTCRKVAKPNLYIKTKYDYFLKYLLNWLKKDILNMTKLNWFMYCCLTFGMLVLSICALFEKEIKECNIVPKKSFISLCLSICIVSLIFITLYILIISNDYLKKYWLYNKNTKKYDVFNNEPCDESSENVDNIVQLNIIILRQRRQILYRENFIGHQRERIIQLSQHILQSGGNIPVPLYDNNRPYPFPEPL